MGSPEHDIWYELQGTVAALENEGLVRGTFRRLGLDKQRQVVLAILAALANRPDGLNIKQIAKAASVSVGSMYQYFPDRDKMVAFAVTLTARYIVSSFAAFEPYLAGLPLKDGLVQYLSGGIEWSKEQAAFLRLFARAAYCGDDTFKQMLVIPVADCMRRMIAHMLEAAADRGEIPKTVNVDSAARLVHGLFVVVGDAVLLPSLNDYFQIYDETTDIAAQLEAATGFALRALGYEEKTASIETEEK